MEDWQTRVVEERDALCAKVTRLASFISSSPVFRSSHDEDRRLLRAQRMAMMDYLDILEDRIRRWG